MSDQTRILARGLTDLRIAEQRRTFSASNSPGVIFRSWQALHQLAARISSWDMKKVRGRNSSFTRLAWSRRMASSFGSLRQHITWEPTVITGWYQLTSNRSPFLFREPG